MGPNNKKEEKDIVSRATRSWREEEHECGKQHSLVRFTENDDDDDYDSP